MVVGDHSGRRGTTPWTGQDVPWPRIYSRVAHCHNILPRRTRWRLPVTKRIRLPALPAARLCSGPYRTPFGASRYSAAAHLPAYRVLPAQLRTAAITYHPTGGGRPFRTGRPDGACGQWPVGGGRRPTVVVVALGGYAGGRLKVMTTMPRLPPLVVGGMVANRAIWRGASLRRGR